MKYLSVFLCISFFFSFTVDAQVLFKAEEGQKIFMTRYNSSGNKVAFFMSEENSSWNIYVYDKDSKLLKRLTNKGMNAQIISGLSWDANDKYIYFVSKSDICDNDFLCSFIVKVDSKGNDANKTLNDLKKSKRLINFEKDSMSTCFGIDFCKCVNCKMKGNIIVSFFNKLSILDQNGKEKASLVDLKLGNIIFHNARWSSNCEKLVFEMWESDLTKRKIDEKWKFNTSIYMLSLTDNEKKITDINSKQLVKVGVSPSKNFIYHSPSFTADGICVLYSKEKNEKFDFSQLFENNLQCPSGMGCGDITNIISYIDKNDKVERDFTETKKSKSTNYQLEQCFCKSRKFIYLERDKDNFYSINEVTLKDSSKITPQKGGLVFFKGRLSIVFPAGSIEEKLKMEILSVKQDVFDVENWIMRILDNRFIDFTNKEKKIKKKVLLFFHYNDLNDDGYIDSISHSVKEDALALYFYNESDREWIKSDFNFNFRENYLNIETSKLYRYGIFIGARGYFPPIIKVLQILGLKTFPSNTANKKGEVVFTASKIISDGDIRVVIEVYNSNDVLIRKLFYPQVDVINIKKRNNINLGNWDLKDSKGKKVKKGMYKYNFYAQDKLNTTKFETKGEILVK